VYAAAAGQHLDHPMGQLRLHGQQFEERPLVKTQQLKDTHLIADTTNVLPAPWTDTSTSPEYGVRNLAIRG
jgi:hypothetical protein